MCLRCESVRERERDFESVGERVSDSCARLAELEDKLDQLLTVRLRQRVG